ncbi:hypothetical protein [Nannocystis punicea]|uniref:Uncharacterized protein n=1 Tax=Nannocystis punicea TaxID=2995304 RepID=A0ABY7H9L9_9BACT|nr:hypothetical protein [Nannocystis poenicansa]WAS95968.1 hypothetical protein O0S08_07365 [Nannocystis poenicansa]
MRKAAWIFTAPMILGLVACGDNGGSTTETTTDNATQATTTGTDTTDETTTGTATESTTTGTETETTAPTTTSPTTTSPTTTTTDDTTTDTTTTGGELTCDAYCGIYQEACVDFAEYDNMQACLDQCGQWPVGTPADTAGDTLGCRMYHVTVASTVDANEHCPHASPNGAGVCVDAAAPACADYCTTYFANCENDLNLYNDEADCLDQCSHWYPGTTADTAGDTVGCRLYHAGVAQTDDVTHCPHAGPGGAGVCVVQ